MRSSVAVAQSVSVDVWGPSVEKKCIGFGLDHMNNGISITKSVILFNKTSCLAIKTYSDQFTTLMCHAFVWKGQASALRQVWWTMHI